VGHPAGFFVNANIADTKFGGLGVPFVRKITGNC
jgi:hypothetical protein